MNWKQFYRLLRPDMSLARARTTIYKRLLKKINVKIDDDGRPFHPARCDISQILCEENGVTLAEFLRHRHRFMVGRDWARRHGIPISLYKYLLNRRKLPFIKIGYKRVYVPRDLDIYEVLEDELTRKLNELDNEIRNLAGKNINAIVFPNWKRYKASWVKRYILKKYASERRLLRVGRTYAVLVSLVGKTLDDLVADEGGDVRKLVYYIPHKPDAARFRRAKEIEIVTLL